MDLELATTEDMLLELKRRQTHFGSRERCLECFGDRLQRYEESRNAGSLRDCTTYR